jgi:RimJ/RimL family protein N-acetyltransferase
MTHRPEILIRDALIEDAPDLKRWLSDPEILRWFPMADEREIDDAVRIWISYANLRAGLTALWEGVPCGSANLYIQPFKKLSHQALFAIIVDQEHRGKGVGSALLEGLKKQAKERFNIEILHLEVYEGNPAIRLYRRAGFVEYGRQEHFIKQNGEYVAKIYMQQVL